ncbi:hypothetical protein [Okeania sp. SIO1F9]|uniref:hypothetical protein n=1 Tax=Okeania sp. SIO1F9 TaxID=2607813 RepID=UPI00145082F4|nr:hypothetical protein [Okeania sp. SIO1F9]NET79486.1 hypothetical protein [Okeania sp. SIO1F9]
MEHLFRWGDGKMGRWVDGEMGRWGDGEMGRLGILKYFQLLPLSHLLVFASKLQQDMLVPERHTS